MLPLCDTDWSLIHTHTGTQTHTESTPHCMNSNVHVSTCRGSSEQIFIWSYAVTSFKKKGSDPSRVPLVQYEQQHLLLNHRVHSKVSLPYRNILICMCLSAYVCASACSFCVSSPTTKANRFIGGNFS